MDKGKSASFSVGFVNAGNLIRVDALIDAANPVRSEDVHVVVQIEEIKTVDNIDLYCMKIVEFRPKDVEVMNFDTNNLSPK